MLRACIGALHDTLRLEDRGYFKTTREQRLGETFEAMAPKIADNIGAMRAAMLPIRLTLQAQPFIGGEEPNYADFIGFAALISLGSVSRSTLLEEDDPMPERYQWLSANANFGRARKVNQTPVNDFPTDAVACPVRTGVPGGLDHAQRRPGRRPPAPHRARRS
jgi:hypothetical protein